jgi:hypothetical protein
MAQANEAASNSDQQQRHDAQVQSILIASAA